MQKKIIIFFYPVSVGANIFVFQGFMMYCFEIMNFDLISRMLFVKKDGIFEKTKHKIKIK